MSNLALDRWSPNTDLKHLAAKVKMVVVSFLENFQTECMFNIHAGRGQKMNQKVGKIQGEKTRRSKGNN